MNGQPDRPYAGLDLDRAAERRRDPTWVIAAAADPRARVHPIWRDRCLVAGDPPAPVALPAEAVRELDASRLVLLGVSEHAPLFTLDLSEHELGDALSIAAADAAVDLRSLFASIPATDSAVLAYARGILGWHREQRHCGRCGAATEPRDGGHLRVCTDSACGRLLFPRIEPAVITIVQASAAPSRCLLARHRASAHGGFSLLAGFVEIGESLEDAVRREILEEAGVVVHDVTYLGSQPWPFPAGLMIAFGASADEEAISVDGDEIVEARWFTRAQLREHERLHGGLGRVDSIDRAMLATWLADEPATPTGSGGPTTRP